MSYALVHRNQLKHAVRWYDTRKGALIGCAAANRNAGYTAYVILCEDDFYQRTVTVTNLLTGQPTEIPKTQAGTCCDPSTERYWSM
jgi:hypothetical protein